MTSRGRLASALLAGAILAGCASAPLAGAPRSGREEAFAELIRMEDRRTFDPALAASTSASPDPWTRARTALSCGRLKDPAVRPLLERLASDPDPSVRESARFSLALSAGERRPRRRTLSAADGRARLVELAASGDPDTAIQALAALAKEGRPSGGGAGDGARDAALARSRDPMPGVAVAALRLLALYRDDPASLARLEEAAAGTGWRAETAKAALGRAEKGPPEPGETRVGLLLVALCDPDRSVGAAALGRAEPDDVVEALGELAGLPDGHARVAAFRDDPDPAAREAARRLLVDTWGERRESFRPIPVPASRTEAGYRRLARLALGTRRSASVDTVRGRFEIDLAFEESPLNVDSFTTLARCGFFEGIAFHRVVPGFVVQGGDPRGDGSGGPGYLLRDEINAIPYERGTVGMALSGPDTGGSQWFVTLAPQPHLDGGYTVIGRVTAGMDVVDLLEQGDRIVGVTIGETPRPAPGAR